LEETVLEKILFDLVTLWVTIDPIGTLPVFIGLTEGLEARARRRAAVKSVLIAGAILLVFLALGEYLLAALQIRLVSFQIAGGIVLFLFALTMVFGKSQTDKDAGAESGHDIAVFPLAMLSIATPGAMLAVVLLTDNSRFNIAEQVQTAGALAVVLAAQLGLLLCANSIVRLIGRSGANILSRVMGMILAAAAVETVVSALLSGTK
jgi:multiple antibiotic resistance protein